MDYAIQLLEREKKTLLKTLKQEDLMRKNIKLARRGLKEIKEITRALKFLKGKIRNLNP